jgi:uncharacterized protein
MRPRPFQGVLRLLSAGFLAALINCIAAPAAVDVGKLPQPTGYVSDLAHVVDPDSKGQLETFCIKVEQQLGVQFALVTIDTIGDAPIRDFALDLARKWGVGSKKDNQGVLLLLAIKDRKSDIETGRGIEPYITDGFSGGTLRAMRPDLRAGDYGRALMMAAQSMANQIAQGKGIAFSGQIATPEEHVRRVEDHGSGIPVPLLILGIVVLFWLLGLGARRGGGSGCLTWFLLGNLLGGGRRGGWGGGGWGGGGFGGGSGGGGGFGGFGGGDFGGGGASSNW